MQNQTTGSQTAPESENVKSAIEDIAIIKRIMDRSEINLRRLGWLFLVYGLVTFTYSVFSILLAVILSRTTSLQTMNIISRITPFLSLAVMTFLFVLFLRKRSRIVKGESVYTMKLYDMWGVMLFVPVVLGIAPAIISMIGSHFGMSQNTVLIYNTVFSIMKYSTAVMCIFVTGHYTGSIIMKVLSLALFILFPVMASFGTPLIDGFDVEVIKDAMSLYGYFSAKISFASIILTIIYICMGIVFLVKQRGSAYGDE